MTYIFILIITILCSWAGITFFRKLKILDRPWNDLKNSRFPVPTLQWLVVYVIILVIVGIFYPSFYTSPLIQWFLAGGSLIVLFETITELEYMGRIKLKVPPIARFFVHAIAACLALYISWISNYEFIISSHTFILPDWLLYLLFACWSIFVINAVNRIDGINAQGNWILTIGFFTIFALIEWVVFPSYTQFNNLDTLIIVKEMSLILAIISLVYTFLEWKPFALIRDVGTMLLAFALAYLSVLWGAKIWTIIVALSLVIFDAIWVWLYRIFIAKKSPMKGDYTHIHHRLLALNWTRSEIRVFVWLFSLFMMMLILMQGTNRLHKIIIFATIALLFFGVNAYLFLYKKLPYWLKQKKE